MSMVRRGRKHTGLPKWAYAGIAVLLALVLALTTSVVMFILSQSPDSSGQQETVGFASEAQRKMDILEEVSARSRQEYGMSSRDERSAVLQEITEGGTGTNMSAEEKRSVLQSL